MSKQVQGAELMPGTWNQTLVGDVMTFPTKDITVSLDNKTPMTSDNTSLDDFDITLVYSITPTSVAELYSTKSKSFHAYDAKEHDTFLMYNYMLTLVNNASYKAVRGYKALDIADNRAKLEAEIRDIVSAQLKEEKLDTSIQLTVVQIRNIKPNAQILQAATDYVKAQNELKIKETEVAIAKKESERMRELASNSGQSIAYMAAQANLLVAQGIHDGKVQTIVVPFDFRGQVVIK
jgi:regulator of protease activity HflC (stomatin/prohibitin superfamily)